MQDFVCDHVIYNPLRTEVCLDSVLSDTAVSYLSTTSAGEKFRNLDCKREGGTASTGGEFLRSGFQPYDQIHIYVAITEHMLIKRRVRGVITS